jgi:hypothetical protein
LYPSPANGAIYVPTTYPGGEITDPAKETGVPVATTLGWPINVELNGPWAQGGDGAVWASGVTATLANAATGHSVPVVVSECGSAACDPTGHGSPQNCVSAAGGTRYGCYFQGGFGIFPLQPLAADTTYRVSVTSGVVTDNLTGARYPIPSGYSWCFSTGPSYTPSRGCSSSGMGGFEAAVFAARVAVSVTGKGSVAGTDLSCAATCAASYPAGASVALTATPGAGQKLIGWSGSGCSGRAPTCTVAVTGDSSVTAEFAPSDTPDISHTTLGGVRAGSPRFGLMVSSARGLPPIRDLIVALPAGVSFAADRAALGHALVVMDSRGHRLRFTAGGAHGALQIALASPAPAVELRVGSAAHRRHDTPDDGGPDRIADDARSGDLRDRRPRRGRAAAGQPERPDSGRPADHRRVGRPQPDLS